MKKIIHGVLCLCLINSLPVFGSTSQSRTCARIDAIASENQRLCHEIKQLKCEIHRIERRSCRSNWNFWGPPYGATGKCQEDCENIGKGTTEIGFSENNNTFNDYARKWGTPRNLLLLAAMGSTVTTSPFLGLRSAFDASDLIVNLPTMNEDLRFLKEHVLVEKKLKCYGLRLPDRPIIELGGKIEGIVFAQQAFNRNPTHAGIDIGSARLDILVEASHAVHAFMAMNMETAAFTFLNNSNLNILFPGSASRIFNSRVYISRAFITIGDLNITPIYFTIGQMFVPFGRFASNMVTSTLTVQLARTNERAILLGLYEKGFYASIYAFRGDADTGTNGINQGGINIGYEKTFDNGSLNIGAGYILSIADATRFQVTGASTGFLGFAVSSATERIVHSVPAVDLHGEFALGKFTFFGEYIWTTRRFSELDLTFNGRGARPTASNFELGYNFKLATYPASVAVGYGTTSEALVLNLPQSSFLGVFNISIWKNTIESLEFRHDKNYPSTTFAGSNGAIPIILPSVGGSRNAVTAQLGVYF